MRKNIQKEVLTKMIKNLSERVIAFPPAFAKITGKVDLETGLFLSQMLFWTNKGTDSEWFYKTIEELEEETYLNRHAQDKSITKLVKLEILEVEKKGIPCKRYFRLNVDKLCDILVKNIDKK